MAAPAVTRNKVAIVTGGASGIGAAVARMLAGDGAHVVIASETPVATMAAWRDRLIAGGGGAEAIQCDVASRAAVAALVADVLARHGRIDSLVNSAGVFHTTPAMDIDMDKVEQLFRVNCLGAINMIQQVLPAMRDAGGGNIVSIASAAGVLGGATFAAYSASKAAIIHFTRTLGGELGRTGIRVNCVAPGSVRTPMTAFSHSPTTPHMQKVLAGRMAKTSSPYGTPFAEADDIANVVMFLLSEQSRAIHGACIVADQGGTAASSPLSE